MTTDNIIGVVEKLVGKINPIGETNTDNERFENLKTLCEVVDILVGKIDAVSYENLNAYEASKIRAHRFAEDFITKQLGIVE